MIRRINKIVALVLVSTGISSAIPNNIFSQIANAAESNQSVINIDTQENTVAMESQDQALKTVVKAMIPGKTGYSAAVISEFKECGSVAYTLDDATALSIDNTLKSNMSQMIAGVNQVKNKGTEMKAKGQATSNNDMIQSGTDLESSATIVLEELNQANSMSDSQLVQMIESEAKNVTVYQYRELKSDDGLTASSPTTIQAEGFVVGGILGIALDPQDTYNAETRIATYNSSTLIENLTLNNNGTYSKSIDLNSSTNKVVCDGLHINVIDSQNNALYVINNPAYNMFKQSKSLYTDEDKKLNILNFPSEVNNLKGYTTDISFNTGTQSIQTTILGLSLNLKNSSIADKKTYKYVAPVDSPEAEMLNVVVSKLGLSDLAKQLVENQMKGSTFVMIPDVQADITNKVNNAIDKINNTVEDITDAMKDLSDAMEDLNDSLNDKNNDVNKAWDKVFDRFDNDPGWAKKDGYWYYYDKDGISLKGVQTIDGKTYYFNRIDGAMETGWQIVNNKKCYFDKDKGYELFTQWVQDGDDWYFVDSSGAVKKSDWVTSGGNYYYVKADGKMAKDWLKVDDNWYFFNSDGSMASSTWKWSDDKWYYLKENGAAANDWLQIGGDWYCFKDSSGELQTGWFRNNGNWYCADDNGIMKTGWAYSSDGWCYLDDSTGKMKKNEWANINGKWYYFNINGTMVTGSRYINGTKYTFNSDGTME